MKKRTLLKRATAIVLATAAILYAALVIGVWAMQEKLMFGRRTTEIVANPSSRNWTYEEVRLDVMGNKTYGWMIPIENARGTVLCSHGSGRNISGYLEDVALFREQGMSVLLYDYGGYGLSTGTPSEARCCADALAMWNYLTEQRGIPPEKIILAGSSMGGGVTGDLASHVSPAAVIMESTFTSIPDTVRDTYPFIPAKWICHIQFRNIDKVPGFRCPTLVVHSKDDTVVPFAHARRLYDRITAPKMFVEIRGSHGGGKFASRDIYSERLKTFFEKHFAQK